MKTTGNIVLCGLGATLLLAAPVWAQTPKTLKYKGAVVSHLRMIDGQPYVSLADVARMLSGSAVRTAGGYEIQTATADAAATPAGGANEVKGLRGVIGQTVFTGKWRFKVVGVSHADQYMTQYQPTTETIKPRGDNDELVVITGILKNAQTQPREPVMSIHALGDTALTDDQGQSYQPIQFDLTNGGFYGPPSMLPGSSQPFAAIFSVRKGTTLKDLVFSLSSYGDSKIDDVRISLAQ